MRISTGLPIGVTALLFGAAERRKSLEDALVGRLAENGYSEVVLPILDYAEPYEALLSPASRSVEWRLTARRVKAKCSYPLDILGVEMIEIVLSRTVTVVSSIVSG